MGVETSNAMRNMVSTPELERRWKAVRTAMKDSGLDFLIMQNTLPNYHGYVRWFADVPVHGNPVTVIFPREEEMTIIAHGGRPPAEPNPPPWAVRGVKKRFSLPFILAMNYTNVYDAEVAVKELEPHGNSRVGVVGPGFVSAAFYQYLMGHLGQTRFEDATDMVDDIKVIKSDEEIKLIRDTCDLQDQVVQYFTGCVRPGRKEFEVRADVAHRCLQLGATELNIVLGVTPAGANTPTRGWYYSDRPLEKGDQISLLLETDGPGGMWAEMVRICVLGKASPELLDHFELARTAQAITVGAMRPGADPLDLWETNNAFLRKAGCAEERRIYAHGQGYDMMERPSLNPGEPMKIRPGMNIAVHPQARSPRATGWVCDNFLTKETGEAEWLHKTPRQVFGV